MHLPDEPLDWALNLDLGAPEYRGLASNLEVYFLLGGIRLYV